MVMSTTTSSSRSSESTPSFNFVVVFFVLGSIGLALFGLPKVAAFSPSSFSQAVDKGDKASITHSWFLRSTASTDADVLAAAENTRILMESQAGGNSSNRRRRKQRIRNSEQPSESEGGSPTFQTTPAELPDPLVPFDSIESVRLVEASNNLEKNACVELILRDNNGSKIVDPRDLHQTSDFDLWMALRKHIVDVSASQLSVVLGTNYFTSREKLLQDKIAARNGSSNNSERDDQETEAIFLETDSEDEKPQSNAKACAWGIKMEPLAFAQYSDLIEATNDRDDDDETEKPQNRVEETGMHLLRHVDAKTGKTYVFGASPDGMVTEHRLEGEDSTTMKESVGLLEIKSLWARRNKGSLPEFHNCPSRFYDQIQGQLAICDKEWCDLMLFIPPKGGPGGGKSKKRKGKAARRRKKQALAAANNKTRKAKGKNYAIVRVKRNETYWNETVLPALVEFCNDIEDGITTKRAKGGDETQAVE